MSPSSRSLERLGDTRTDKEERILQQERGKDESINLTARLRGEPIDTRKEYCAVLHNEDAHQSKR